MSAQRLRQPVVGSAPVNVMPGMPRAHRSAAVRSGLSPMKTPPNLHLQRREAGERGRQMDRAVPRAEGAGEHAENVGVGMKRYVARDAGQK